MKLRSIVLCLAAAWVAGGLAACSGSDRGQILGTLERDRLELTLGLLASTLAQTQRQMFQRSFFVLLPSILLSGFVFPFDGMPSLAQWIAQLLPLTHFIELVRGIVLRGAGLGDLMLPIYKLLGFMAVSLTAVTLRFHKRLD